MWGIVAAFMIPRSSGLERRESISVSVSMYMQLVRMLHLMGLVG